VKGFLLSLLALGFQEGLAETRKAIASGDYRGAWELVLAESNELVRLSGQAELLYKAGDPAGALKAATAGLEIAPTQTELIYYAACAAIWLEEATSAIAFSNRLAQAADERKDSSGNSWRQAGEELAVRASSIAERDEQLAHSVKLLRLVAMGGIAAWILGIGIALLLQGRSRRPVS